VRAAPVAKGLAGYLRQSTAVCTAQLQASTRSKRAVRSAKAGEAAVRRDAGFGGAPAGTGGAGVGVAAISHEILV